MFAKDEKLEDYSSITLLEEDDDGINTSVHNTNRSECPEYLLERESIQNVN